MTTQGASGSAACRKLPDASGMLSELPPRVEANDRSACSALGVEPSSSVSEVPVPVPVLASRRVSMPESKEESSLKYIWLYMISLEEALIFDIIKIIINIDDFEPQTRIVSSEEQVTKESSGRVCDMSRSILYGTVSTPQMQVE
uniref:Uncharacterized protein n=1 Tax=Glossina pallidipes TaxID=7398 RepID=A0A1A9Z7R2_GLOPL